MSAAECITCGETGCTKVHPDRWPRSTFAGGWSTDEDHELANLRAKLVAAELQAEVMRVRADAQNVDLVKLVDQRAHLMRAMRNAEQQLGMLLRDFEMPNVRAAYQALRNALGDGP